MPACGLDLLMSTRNPTKNTIQVTIEIRNFLVTLSEPLEPKTRFRAYRSDLLTTANLPR